MSRAESRWSGWRGISLIAITFVYFLIFAQFALLTRLAELGITDAHLKAVMAAMGAGGIIFSLLAPRISLYPSPQFRLRTALAACAAAAFFTLLPLTLISAIAVSLLIGCGLGLLTVTLVTHLRLWLGSQDPLMNVGIGTGLGYFICNIPAFFTASARLHALAAGSFCLLGILSTLGSTTGRQGIATGPVDTVITRSPVNFIRVLISFTALVWLDSAAFFIIQNTPTLKAGTWAGTLHLTANGLLHFTGALLSVLILRRRGLPAVLSFAFLALGLACLLLLDPARAPLASMFYPVGVSLYSVALVAYPSLLAPASSAAERGRKAGWIYATAGWFGSAMGVGMGQNLGHVPPAFVGIAGALVLSPGVMQFLRRRRRESFATGAVLLAAFGIDRGIGAMHSPQPSLSPAEQGRQVYIGEGCISCHSQYVRPDTPDVLLWGPVKPLSELRRENPPLIGNRRQGPDLTEVGSRRSALWLKAHLYDPSALSHASFMPSYSYLFTDSRGEDLVAYLQSLRTDNIPQHRLDEDSWRLSSQVTAEANAGDGPQIFADNCSTCHAPMGTTRNSWLSAFHRLPPDLATGPYAHVVVSDTPDALRDRFAQILKFGLPGTDMPGHEYLSDHEIASLSLWLAQRIPQTLRRQETEPDNISSQGKP